MLRQHKSRVLAILQRRMTWMQQQPRSYKSRRQDGGKTKNGPPDLLPGHVILAAQLFILTRECPWTIKIGTRAPNTFVVLIICVYVLASKDAIKRRVRVGILLRSRNVDARETSCDRKYVLAAWVRLSSVVFVCRRCITPLSCETGLY